MSKRPVRTSHPKRPWLQRVHSASVGFSASTHLGHAEAYLSIYLHDLPPSPGNGKDWGLARPPIAAPESRLQRASERSPRGLRQGPRERLPMSELQNASWGWLGEHVHASAPQSPRLQLPRSTTSPSQGVIAAAVAGAAARVYKVALRATGRVAAACARSPARLLGATLARSAPPSECPAGRDGVRRSCLGAGAGLGGWAVSLGGGAGAEGAEGGEAVRASARCPLCAAAPRPSDIARVPPGTPSRARGARRLRPIAEPHYLIGPPKRGRGRGRGATGRGRPSRSGPFRE